MKRLITLVIVIGVLAVLAGCTPTEHAAWLRWHAADPAAAEQFADQVVTDYAARATQRNVWDELAWCESGENWSYNGGSGYDGGLQFLPAVWNAYGGQQFASHAWGATREQQIIVAERILADVGWGAWPACSRKLGLR